MKNMKTEFIHAYADVNDMLQESIFTVIDKIRGELEEYHENDNEEVFFDEEEYVDLYIEAYNAMKEAGLDWEVKRLMKTENMDFIVACEDFDLIALC